MDRDEIEAALEDLGAELGRRGVQAKVSIVGGVAMVLAYRARHATRDVDGSAYPADKVLAAARVVASRRGLPDDWLNYHAVAFFPPVEHGSSWLPVRRYGGLEVFVADAPLLLAMKLRASRGSRDQADIEFLLRQCRVSSVAEALSIYDGFFPEDPMPRVHRDALGELVARVAGPTGPGPAGPPVGGGRGDAGERERHRWAENRLLWVNSPRGSVSHRIGRPDGDDVITACGQRLSQTGLVVGRSPRKRRCERCSTRRPER
jgi:hypothetical protein